MDVNDPLLKIVEVAKVLNMTPDHIRRTLIAPAGPLPVVKVGRQWRVKQSDLQKYLRKGHITGTRPVNA